MRSNSAASTPSSSSRSQTQPLVQGVVLADVDRVRGQLADRAEHGDVEQREQHAEHRERHGTQRGERDARRVFPARGDRARRGHTERQDRLSVDVGDRRSLPSRSARPGGASRRFAEEVPGSTRARRTTRSRRSTGCT